jgi:hypothetical protein
MYGIKIGFQPEGTDEAVIASAATLELFEVFMMALQGKPFTPNHMI